MPGVAYRDVPAREDSVSPMTGVSRPRGPLPPRVYWVRRTLVLAVALGLVFGIAQLLDGGSRDSDETAQVVGSPSAPSTSAAVPRSTDDARPGDDRGAGSSQGRGAKKGSKGRKPEETQTPLAVPTGPCRNEEVVVEPKVRPSAHAGRVVHFRLKLTTTGRPACTWTLSPETLVVKITSGEDRIWSSQDCPDAVPQTDVVVRKDVPAKVDMGWRGQRSDSTCSRQPAWAQAGFYHVQTAAYGAEPADVQFELQVPVVPTRTTTPKPEKQDKDAEKKDREKPRDEPHEER